jgi:hypothetical protein
MGSNVDYMRLDDAFLKRSAKLLPCQKEMVVYWRDKGMTFQSLADMFKVSKRTIVFIVYPEKKKENYKRRIERGGSTIYYKKENHNKAIQNYREFKRELFINKNQ